MALFGKYNFGSREKDRPKPPGWTRFEVGRQPQRSSLREKATSVAGPVDAGPFCLFLCPVNPHAPPSHNRSSRINLSPARLLLGSDEADASDKPGWVEALRQVGPEKPVRENRTKVAQTLMGVDQEYLGRR